MSKNEQPYHILARNDNHVSLCGKTWRGNPGFHAFCFEQANESLLRRPEWNEDVLCQKCARILLAAIGEEWDA